MEELEFDTPLEDDYEVNLPPHCTQRLEIRNPVIERKEQLKFVEPARRCYIY